jgi:hypothetical protein
VSASKIGGDNGCRRADPRLTRGPRHGTSCGAWWCGDARRRLRGGGTGECRGHGRADHGDRGTDISGARPGADTRVEESGGGRLATLSVPAGPQQVLAPRRQGWQAQTSASTSTTCGADRARRAHRVCDPTSAPTAPTRSAASWLYAPAGPPTRNRRELGAGRGRRVAGCRRREGRPAPTGSYAPAMASGQRRLQRVSVGVPVEPAPGASTSAGRRSRAPGHPAALPSPGARRRDAATAARRLRYLPGGWARRSACSRAAVAAVQTT